MGGIPLGMARPVAHDSMAETKGRERGAHSENCPSEPVKTVGDRPQSARQDRLNDDGKPPPEDPSGKRNAGPFGQHRRIPSAGFDRLVGQRSVIR